MQLANLFAAALISEAVIAWPAHVRRGADACSLHVLPSMVLVRASPVPWD